LKKFSILRNFNWKILLLRIVVNAAALLVISLLLPDIYFVDKTVGSVLIAALVLGVLNAVIKPLLMFLTAQLFFATFGLLLIFINTVLLYLLEWLLPNRFAVNNFFWALLAGLLLSIVTNGLENLIGVSPPIVPEGEVEIKRQIQEASVTPMQRLAGMSSATVGQDMDTQSLEEVQAARAALEVINEAEAGPPESTPAPQEAAPPGQPPPADEILASSEEPDEQNLELPASGSSGGQA
jgi:putative membrane protein